MLKRNKEIIDEENMLKRNKEILNEEKEKEKNDIFFS